MVIGGEWEGCFLLSYLITTIPHKSPYSHHGEPTLENGMRFPGQACAASVPHHKQFLDPH
jgi:hypothetical protein